MLKRYVAFLVALCTLGSFSSSAVAAEAPRWSIISSSAPTNLAPNSPRDEVQNVTVDATGGTFALTLTDESHACKATAPIPFNATAAEFQATLESCTGGGTVAVTGGPGNANPYVVTFVGELDNRPVAVMTADSSSLTGGAATASVTEAVKGAFVPMLTVMATNVGGAATDGSTITLGDLLPAGLTASTISGYDAYAARFAFAGHPAFGGEMTCSAPPTLSCTYSGIVAPGDSLVVTIPLSVAASGLPPSVLNQATVAGGGAASEATVNTPIAISDTVAGFGPSAGSVIAATSTNQAGAHANVTTSFALNTRQPNGAVSNVKDIRFDLPPGLVGSTVGMPKCTMAVVLHGFQGSKCPGDTMVGIATVTIGTGQLGPNGGPETVVVPVYNIAPAPGEPAAFALNALLLPVRLDTSVLSNGTYGVRVTAPDVSEAAVVLSTSITIWGVPADHTGPGPNGEASIFGQEFGGHSSAQTRVPLLTNPQQCIEPLSASMSTDAWTTRGVFISSGAVPMGTLTGCGRLSFESSFTMLPDTLEAGAPAGYSFDLDVLQNKGPDELATPNVKDVKLTLPLGTVVSPSAAVGLRACSDAQFALHSGAPGACPREAQVGEVRVKSPALEEALEGQVYLAEPECNPCTPEDARDGRMVRLFLQVVSEGEGGIIVKLAGKSSIDQVTGQITTTFENNPQLPFSSLKLTLVGGPRAVLANPRACGPVRSNLDLTPWSAPFTSDSTPSYGFEVNQGCFGPQFNPSFTAGLPNLQAGEYGPFTLSFGRGDHDQFLSGLELHMPPGLVGSLAHVPLCPEPQAAQGTCGSQSLIGHTQVLTGPGADPFLVTGGEVFLTEGHKGAPFGLSIVVPAKAGPYTLSGTTGQGTVVVRAKIDIDPHTAALTVKSDPLPTVLDGIPLQLQIVNVTIDRNAFTFGPTNCSKLQVTGTLSSTEGTNAAVSSPFQVTNCARLAFRPKFKVATSGKPSKARGASLDVKLTFPSTPQGSEANIARVKVELPKQLPSRLTTLQQACLANVFDANPAACPAGSIVGYARAVTPILPVPLTGPAYFVSHGGEAFPSLIVVLQGYGVTVELVGTTFIKAGITSSTFKAVPDVPVGSFELHLPQGKYSALAANGNLCKRKLAMPAEFVAQNGAVLHQSTPIAVTGCPKAKKARKARKPRRARGARKISHRHID